jgi:hypothetical protein
MSLIFLLVCYVASPCYIFVRLSLNRMGCRYAPPHPCAIWPLSANILDPVRLSLVADGPARMLELVKWFSGDASEATGLPVVRMKNKFGLAREDVPDGYRDVKIFVAYTSPTGLGIVGEIQARVTKSGPNAVVTYERHITACTQKIVIMMVLIQV